ncbi:MAG: asparagine synthase (glutamine-hydrolyzing) [bacterium]
MCGIAGLYHLQREPVPCHRLKSMCDAMAHRGPDDEGYVYFPVLDEPYKNEGYWVERGSEMPAISDQRVWRELFGGNGDFNLALGHRRLAVIDLSDNAHQPMSNRANGIWVTYNGEIYNYRELRSQMQQAGHHFFSQSDTEVLIHLYESFGVDALKQLNGIFSFALWDGQKNRLLLARDRYGAKPLYYVNNNGLLAFASEVKALLELDEIKAEISAEALCDYFTFQNTFGSQTLFKGIELLEAGHFLLVENGNLTKRRYWDFEFSEGPDRGEQYFAETLKDVFGSSVRGQMVSDVPLGSYLSGGLDSGGITAMAAQEIPRLMTFTGGFDVATAVSIENFFDERDKAELMSRTFGTEHYQMVIHAGDLQWALPRVIWHAEDLRVGMSYPHYYLSQLAAKFVKVVLAGAGGDETLAGYPWRYHCLTGQSSEHDFRQALYQCWTRLIGDEDRDSFFSPTIMASLQSYSPQQKIAAVMDQCGATSLLKRALYFDAKTFLHGILVIEDKLSMAHSLESRVPFLDNDLVELTSSIPSKYLLNDSWCEAAGKDINLVGKYIFRRAMSSVLPEQIVINRKQGFSAPDQSWYMQQLVEYIRTTILSERSLSRGYFQPEYLEKVIDDHIAGRANNRLLIWSLLSFEWWNRLFIDGDRLDCECTQQHAGESATRPASGRVPAACHC